MPKDASKSNELGDFHHFQWVAQVVASSSPQESSITSAQGPVAQSPGLKSPSSSADCWCFGRRSHLSVQVVNTSGDFQNPEIIDAEKLLCTRVMAPELVGEHTFMHNVKHE